MTMIAAPNGMESIEREECLRLLAGDVVGRIVVVRGSTPSIFPVNYALDGETVVFRTGAGTKLEAGPRSPACFEVDGFDRETRSGWSVVVTGRLEEVTPYDSGTWDRATALPVQTWAAGPKDHVMRLVPTRITGRRIAPAR